MAEPANPLVTLLYDKSSIVKGGEVSRAVPVNTDGMRAIDELVRWHREQYRTVNASRPLFPSRNGKGKQRMTRRAAHNVLKDAFEAAGLNGHLATHSLRKSFAQRLYEQTGDVFTVQEILGHKSIATTQKYLGVNYASVREALQKMSLDGELHESNLLGSSLKSTADETSVSRTGFEGVRPLQAPRRKTKHRANRRDRQNRITSGKRKDIL